MMNPTFQSTNMCNMKRQYSITATVAGIVNGLMGIGLFLVNTNLGSAINAMPTFQNVIGANVGLDAANVFCMNVSAAENYAREIVD